MLRQDIGDVILRRNRRIDRFRQRYLRLLGGRRCE